MADIPATARPSGILSSHDPLAADRVPAWRRAQREDLLAARARLTPSERQEVAAAIAGHLDRFLAGRGLMQPGTVLSGYWPIRSEPDLRPWFLRQEAAGIRLALPVVETRAAPLVFRPWTQGAAMERGHWNILVPATPEHVVPGIAFAPLVGWDGQGYRLGYGGGYFDRTLAAAKPRPLVIGVGYHEARLATIYPQPHDIRLDAIITEAGLQAG